MLRVGIPKPWCWATRSPARAWAGAVAFPYGLVALSDEADQGVVLWDGVAVVTGQKRRSDVSEWPELAGSWGFDGM